MDRPGRIALVLVLLGVAGVASPLAVYEPHERHYFVDTDPEGVASLPAGATAVDYEDLPEGEQRAVPEVSGGQIDYFGHTGSPPERGDVFSATEWRRSDGLGASDYVAHQGRYHRIETRTFTATPRFPGGRIVALRATGLGAVALVVGGLVLWTRSLRPLTPARAALLPVAVAGAGVVYVAVDSATLGGGSDGVLSLPMGGLTAVVASAAVLGSAVARRNRPVAGGYAVLFAAYVVVGLAPHRAPLANQLALVVANCAPFFVLGYLLTDGETGLRNRFRSVVTD